MSDNRTPYLGLEFPPPRTPPKPDVWERPELPEAPEEEPQPRPIRTNILLFVLTVASVFMAGAPMGSGMNLLSGWTFAVPLLAILLFHEFGHYIAARLHRVDASLPYFLPLPFLSPFGTLGAVIAMRGRIRSRDALLDIGAAGPLAGLFVALPVLAYGLSLSQVGPVLGPGAFQEGQSLLYMALKRLVLGPIPEGQDVNLHPTAFAGWAGLLVTMINMVPWGQLDGGHIAYALFGPAYNRAAPFVRRFLLLAFLYNVVVFFPGLLRDHSGMGVLMFVSRTLFWLMWYGITGFIGRASGGVAHPPTDPGELSPVRKVVAAVTLAFFVLLFMPTPLYAL